MGIKPHGFFFAHCIDQNKRGPMNKTAFSKYKPYPVVDLPNRQWPSNTIKQAPIWSSVDLRDGNQALRDPMNLEEKTEMFQMLVNLGFKEIEIGFPSASEVEFNFLRKLIEEGMIPDDVTVQVLTQAREHLIQKTFEALKGTKKAIVHLYNSTSTLQRKVVFQKDKQEIIEIALEGTKLVKKYAEIAKEQGTKITFEYSPESFTGTELDYALEICEEVMKVWQPTKDHRAIINLPATVEMSTPNIYADRIEWFSNNYSNRETVYISVHNHNDRGTAVASTELALLAGADRVEGTLFGHGERTGNVDLVTVALNLFSQGIDPELDFSNIQDVIDICERVTKMPVPERHPYAGDLVYTAFSGSHQDAIKKGMKAYKKEQNDVWGVPYLPIDPHDVGRNYEAIIRINSQSGKGGAAYIMSSKFGFELPKAMYPEFGKLVQKISDQTGIEVPSDKIWDCFEENYLLVSKPYQLHTCEIKTVPQDGDEEITRVKATMFKDGSSHEIFGEGNGPIDAFVHGMKDTFQLDFKVMSYSEHAITETSASKAAAYLQVEDANQVISFGVGVDTNISIASMKGIISAINRMLNA
ncbi:MAG: 2-isopropylmalate synthase [bacterium]